MRFCTTMIVLQIAFLAVGLALCGGDTKEGQALLLVSLFCFGAFVGCSIRMKVGGEDNDR